jgi:hypothetical protein
MWWMRASVIVVSAAVAAIASGCSPHSAAAPVMTDRLYTVQPDSARTQVGTVAGEIVRMKVTQRVEQDSGRSLLPARLTGRLFLQNISADQPIRVTGAHISYLDAQGQPIRLDNDRAEPSITFGSSSGASRRLNPGQNATELLDAEFPAAALKAGALKEIQIRLELSNVPRVQMLNFAVAIGGS